MKRKLSSYLDGIKAFCAQLFRKGSAEIADNRSFEEQLADLREFTARLTEDAEWLKKTEIPTETDFTFIGKFIQIYCAADLNARATVNALRAINIGEIHDFAGTLSDADVLLHLKLGAAAWTGHSSVPEGIVKAANTLEMHRLHRHSFAHWVVRRIPGEDAFVILTKNAREATRRDGDAQDRNEAKFGVMALPGMRMEMKKLAGHSDYLGHLSEYLEREREQLRTAHLDRRA